MSNPSLSYDPTQTNLTVYPLNVDSPIDSAGYAKAGVMTKNLIEKLSTNDNFRDVFIGTILQDVDQMAPTILEPFIQSLQTNPSTDSNETRALCEVVAGLSFGWGDKELAKRALLRVSPTKASNYLRTIYSALVERNIAPDMFRSMTLITLPQAIENWERSQ